MQCNVVTVADLYPMSFTHQSFCRVPLQVSTNRNPALINDCILRPRLQFYVPLTCMSVAMMSGSSSSLDTLALRSPPCKSTAAWLAALAAHSMTAFMQVSSATTASRGQTASTCAHTRTTRVQNKVMYQGCRCWATTAVRRTGASWIQSGSASNVVIPL